MANNTTTDTALIIDALKSNLKWANDIYRHSGGYFGGVWHYLTEVEGRDGTLYTLECEGEKVESWRE